MKKLLFATTIILCTSLAANAQRRTLADEKVQIRNGVQSGQLTVAEVARLKAQAQKLQNEKALYKSDGVLTPAEKCDLKKDNRRLNANIYKQKHDRQKRG